MSETRVNSSTWAAAAAVGVIRKFVLALAYVRLGSRKLLGVQRAPSSSTSSRCEVVVVVNLEQDGQQMLPGGGGAGATAGTVHRLRG